MTVEEFLKLKGDSGREILKDYVYLERSGRVYLMLELFPLSQMLSLDP